MIQEPVLVGQRAAGILKSVSYAHVFELDDEIYMLYQGNEMGRYGFGLAQLIDRKF